MLIINICVFVFNIKVDIVVSDLSFNVYENWYFVIEVV